MKRHPGRKVALLLLLLSGITACTSRPPEILREHHQLIYLMDREWGKAIQKLSVHVAPDDPDGFDDLASLHLIHDEAELFWALEKEDWIDREEGGSRWIGSNGFSMPDGSDLPPGEYRVLLTDASGERAETTFLLAGRPVDRSALRFPEAVIEGGVVFAPGLDVPAEIWVYDSVFQRSFVVGDNGLALDDIYSALPELMESFAFFLYSYDRRRDIGLVVGPYFP